VPLRTISAHGVVVDGQSWSMKKTSRRAHAMGVADQNNFF
jgi:hypothetical protein